MAETKHLIGAAELAKVKRGARLINVGRGSLLDEAALICALKTGALGGAAIDVAETEPLPADSPLWKAPNLFITPHTSALSDRLWVRQAALLVELLERWFDGEEMFNQVDLDQQMRVKCAFDPNHLLNPGKVFPQLRRCAELGRMHVHGGRLAFPDIPRF